MVKKHKQIYSKFMGNGCLWLKTINKFIRSIFRVNLKLCKKSSTKKIRKNVFDKGLLCWKLWGYNWRDNIFLALIETIKRRKFTASGLPHEKYGVWNEMFDMKRDLHNLNLGFIQLKRNVHFDSTDNDCPKEPPRSEWAPNHTRAPIAQDSSKGNQCTRRSIPRT